MNKTPSKSPVKPFINKCYWCFVIMMLLVAMFIAWRYYQPLTMPNHSGLFNPIGPVELNDGIDNSIALDTVHIDRVFVDKSSRTMQLLSDDKVIRSYHIALGDNPKGHKQFEGDERTPEGIYTLDYKNENSIAYRSIHISYPNEQDIAHAKALGKPPGGAIMIHGQMNGFEALTDYYQQHDWTDGCIAVTNEEMDEIMAAVKIGTPIEIEW